MPNANKRKGKYFEDKIANDYREIFKLDKLECYRSSNSGARTSIEYNGDITFKEPLKYNLITECKFYSTLELTHIFPVCNSYIDEWISQLINEKKHYINNFNKDPLAIIIASKPYLKFHYVILLEDKIKDIIPKITFYSNKHKKYFTMITYDNIELLFKKYKLI